VDRVNISVDPIGVSPVDNIQVTVDPVTVNHATVDPLKSVVIATSAGMN
jgi:hypothetical protein